MRYFDLLINLKHLILEHVSLILGVKINSVKSHWTENWSNTNKCDERKSNYWKFEVKQESLNIVLWIIFDLMGHDNKVFKIDLVLSRSHCFFQQSNVYSGSVVEVTQFDKKVNKWFSVNESGESTKSSFVPSFACCIK